MQRHRTSTPRQPTSQPLHVLCQVKVEVPLELKFNIETVDGALVDSGEPLEAYFREGLDASTSGCRVTLAHGAVAAWPTIGRVASLATRYFALGLHEFAVERLALPGASRLSFQPLHRGLPTRIV